VDAGVLGPEALAGAAALAAVLALGTVIGLVRHRRDGRFRAATGAASASREARPLPEAEPAQSAGKDTANMGTQPRSGPGTGASPDAGRDALTAGDLGADLGERATLVQFSTAFCQPCRATRRTLAEVGAMVGGVAHVEVDAESHLDLVRRLGIMRTPAVMVLDDAGRIVRRAAGQPRKPDVIAALGEAITGSPSR